MPENPTEHQVLTEMQRTGGSFASALAVAWMRADPENRAKLREAFDSLYQKYERRAAENMR